MHYKERQLKLVSLILEHQIFVEFFDYVVSNAGEIPNGTLVQKRMRELNACNESQIGRRSQTVRCWIRWIFDLIKL